MTDYSELLSRAENETHRSGMWADTCLLIDDLSAAIRALIAERDEAMRHANCESVQSCTHNFLSICKQRNEFADRAEAAEKRLAEYEKALRFYADERRWNGPNMPPIEGDEYAPKDSSYCHDVMRDHGSIARAALARKGEG